MLASVAYAIGVQSIWNFSTRSMVLMCMLTQGAYTLARQNLDSTRSLRESREHDSRASLVNERTQQSKAGARFLPNIHGHEYMQYKSTLRDEEM
jgi:hypothetical protein